MGKNPTVGTRRGMHPPSRRLLRSIIVPAVLFIVVLMGIADYLEKWLWMRQLDYAGLFWTLLSLQWAMFCSAFVFAFLFLWINLRQAEFPCRVSLRKRALNQQDHTWRDRDIGRDRPNAAGGGLSSDPATPQKTNANPATSRMPKPIIAKLTGSKAGVLNIENTPRLSAR